MWIFTTSGFLSVVADAQRPGHVLVRARARDDIEAFAAAAGASEPTAREDRDYRWRTSVPAADFAAWLASQGEAIDYTNFKDAVAVRQGSDRAHRYSRVWSVMHGLQVEEDART